MQRAVGCRARHRLEWPVQRKANRPRILVGAVMLLLLGGCTRAAHLPPDQAPRLLRSASRGEPALVETLDGKTVRIDHFDRLEIYHAEPCGKAYCPSRKFRHRVPFDFRIEDSALRIGGPRNFRTYPLEELTHLSVLENDLRRLDVVACIAGAVGIAAAGITFAALRPRREDMQSALDTSLFVGLTAGSLTLPFSLPATRHLSEYPSE